MFKDWPVTRDSIRTMLLRRGRSAADVDDLLQESWLRYAIYKRHKPVACPGAFLTRVALNLAVDNDRALAVRREEHLMDEHALLDTAPGTEATVLARERLARLDTCLDRLSDKTRDIFLDIRVGGMTFAEVARHHRMSVSGVEKHVAKATLLIGGWMENWWN